MVKRIAICGLARSGKHTLARAMRDSMPEGTALVDTWAGALKGFAMEIFDLTLEQVNGIDFDREAPYFPGGQSIRQLLQELGTDFGRAYDPNLWVKATLRRQRSSQVKWLLMADTRFPNELAACDYSVWVDRPGLGAVARDHESERSINRLMVDQVVMNDGAVGTLQRRATLFMDELKALALEGHL